MDITKNLEDYKSDRFINILQNGNKFQKKQVLKELRTLFVEAEPEIVKSSFDKLLIPISLAFQEQAEMCREAAIEVCLEAICKIKPDAMILCSLIPAIHNRLCSDSVYESSEELKLLYIELVLLLIERYEEMVMPFINELVEILCKGIADCAPEVKKKSCFSAILLARIQSIRYQSHLNKLVKPLAEAVKHQHWRVRVAVIEAMEIIILNGDPKILPDALASLTNRFFDDNTKVRLALTKLIGNWMLNHYDRYSYFSQMIPLILTSLTDNDEIIRNEGNQLWDAVGNQYAHENEKDLKDKMDWIDETLTHYPEGVTRPCLGCRTLVEREVGKFVLAIGKELSDWVVSVRIKSAQLLSQVVLHAEKNITQDLHKIIVPMSKAAMDEETPAVIHFVMLAAKYLGYFIPPKTYCPLIFEYIHEANYGELKIISSIIQGSKPGELEPFLPKINHLLDHPTFNGKQQNATLDLIHAIFTVCGERSLVIGEVLFKALISVAGLAATEAVARRANEFLLQFNDIGGGDRRIVFNKYCKPLLEYIVNAHWTVNCYQQFIFTALVFYAGEIIEENVDIILEILRKCLCKEETDPECILKIIMALNKIITEENTTLPSPEIREMFKVTVLKDILSGQLMWKAGRSAEAVRTIATTTLFLLLPRQLPEHFLPIVIGLVEDTSIKTRQLALACLTKCASLHQIHDHKNFVDIITTVLKRLDDCDQKIREMSLESIVALYQEEVNNKEKDDINKSLLDFVLTTLLIHLDDQDPKFQSKVIDCLKSIGKLNLEGLLRKIIVDKFRDKDIARHLVSFIESELSSTSKNDFTVLK